MKIMISNLCSADRGVFVLKVDELIIKKGKSHVFIVDYRKERLFELFSSKKYILGGEIKSEFGRTSVVSSRLHFSSFLGVKEFFLDYGLVLGMDKIAVEEWFEKIRDEFGIELNIDIPFAKLDTQLVSVIRFLVAFMDNPDLIIIDYDHDIKTEIFDKIIEYIRTNSITTIWTVYSVDPKYDLLPADYYLVEGGQLKLIASNYDSFMTTPVAYDLKLSASEDTLIDIEEKYSNQHNITESVVDGERVLTLYEVSTFELKRMEELFEFHYDLVGTYESLQESYKSFLDSQEDYQEDLPKYSQEEGIDLQLDLNSEARDSRGDSDDD